ncbi:nuclear nucleic acid-binding protein C1D isoform X2 [Rhinatrema bivittatum]|uniref:nuclear nucleic acid-binding protein C1D isoform X2 n=1 Tax=Rhinatrema bivittatum TaxID=194408 RepID=UPI001126211F|nr:nuclear nucleic acid-binding protein C1D isoform X2 [Rhinatrema bivittatum]
MVRAKGRRRHFDSWQPTDREGDRSRNLAGPLRLLIRMTEDINEEYPSEIHDYLLAFDSSVGCVDEMLTTMMSVSRSELLQKLDPLEQAKLDLVSAYTLNSLFWVYLATQGVNPKEHPVKQELERIRAYMNKVKEIMDRKKAARLDKGAAARFLRNALWEPRPEEDSVPKKKQRRKDK